MSELLKQLEGAAKELDTLVEMYVRNDSPTRAADCTAKAASVREAVALLSPSGAPAGLVEAATALSRGAIERLLEGPNGAVTVWQIEPAALRNLRMALAAALSPAPQVAQETVQQKVPLGGEARKWVETYLAGLRQSLERIEKDRSEYELEPLQGFIARAAEGNRWVIAALEAALSAPPPAQQKDGEQQ